MLAVSCLRSTASASDSDSLEFSDLPSRDGNEGETPDETDGEELIMLSVKTLGNRRTNLEKENKFSIITQRQTK